MKQSSPDEGDVPMLRAELAARLAEVEGLRIDLHRKQMEVADATQAVSDLRRRIAELLDSKSWWITRPLRALYGAVRREGGSEGGSNASVAPSRRGVEWGSFARVTPISAVWGIDRGLPVDRHYIHGFLAAHRQDIRGRVLEIKDSYCTSMFGGRGVTSVDVLDIDSANPHATLKWDLADADPSQAGQFDCFILTQTLHIIYDIRAAVSNALRLLAPGGVLLCTIPAVSRVNYENGGLESGDYWRLTAAAVRRLFAEFADEDAVSIETYGNVQVCAAFLYGLAAEELEPGVLSYRDPWFPLVHCIRAVRRVSVDE